MLTVNANESILLRLNGSPLNAYPSWILTAFELCKKPFAIKFRQLITGISTHSKNWTRIILDSCGIAVLLGLACKPPDIPTVLHHSFQLDATRATECATVVSAFRCLHPLEDPNMNVNQASFKLRWGNGFDRLSLTSTKSLTPECAKSFAQLGTRTFFLPNAMGMPCRTKKAIYYPKWKASTICGLFPLNGSAPTGLHAIVSPVTFTTKRKTGNHHYVTITTIIIITTINTMTFNVGSPTPGQFITTANSNTITASIITSPSLSSSSPA